MNELIEKFCWYGVVGIIWLCLQFLFFVSPRERKYLLGEFSRISRLWSIVAVALMILMWWMFMLEFYWTKFRERKRGNQKIPPIF